MPRLVIRLDPMRLSNPDLDLRYEIPNRLRARSGGRIHDDGYDYDDAEERKNQPCLLSFFQTKELDAAVAEAFALIREERPLGNDLRGAAEVSVFDDDNDDEGSRVVYP